MILWLSSISAVQEPSSDPSMLWVRVIAFLGILGAGAYFLTQYNRKIRVKASNPTDSRLFIADTRAIGNKQYLVVAQYGEDKHLLGVSSNSINHLAKIDETRTDSKPLTGKIESQS